MACAEEREAGGGGGGEGELGAGAPKVRQLHPPSISSDGARMIEASGGGGGRGVAFSVRVQTLAVFSWCSDVTNRSEIPCKGGAGNIGCKLIINSFGFKGDISFKFFLSEPRQIFKIKPIV